MLSVTALPEQRMVSAALACREAHRIGLALLDLPGVKFNRNGDYELPDGNYVHRWLADADLVEQDALGRLAAARDIRARKAREAERAEEVEKADAARDEWANALCGTNYGAIDCVESRIFVDRAVAHAESKNG